MGPVVTGIIGAFLVGGAYSFFRQRRSPIAIGIMGVIGIALMVSAGIQYFVFS